MCLADRPVQCEGKPPCWVTDQRQLQEHTKGNISSHLQRRRPQHSGSGEVTNTCPHTTTNTSHVPWQWQSDCREQARQCLRASAMQVS